ncbi:alpha-tubulin suppressor-like RCC1 family protein [Paenibacillus brasilensis]|uniref:Alpha-tubulin suppressor-like RCC1 family protein n=1 Tax=Paenibacillus brasilensis TaxID=128574 RepID=A0ABU0L091_9BACL|nr:alpha-tubulin suppressor-like RCC1 family protein [Paenibacillus brasilensis]
MDYISRKEAVFETNRLRNDTIAAGRRHTVGLKTDGTVTAVGDNKYGQCNVSDWCHIVSVVAGNVHMATNTGNAHTIGLKSDGTVTAVGWNRHDQCDVSDWHDIRAVAAGCAHTLGLKSDGTVVAVGDNDYGQCDVSGWSSIINKPPLTERLYFWLGNQH